MALDFDTNAEQPTGASEPMQFQSVEQWLGSTQFSEMMKNEFPEDASEWLDPVSRRKFMGLMGASLALAGTVGCNPSLKPASAQKIVPYVKKPEAIVPGVPIFFPTAFTLGGIATGLLVKSVEGRPIKVEGNPAHPSSLGGSDVFAQASVLNLYDPERAKTISYKGDPGQTWEKARAALGKVVTDQLPKKGAGLRIVSEATAAGSAFAKLMSELKTKLPDMQWIQYEAVSRENALKGTYAAYGKYVSPVYHLDKADTLVVLDCDVLSLPGGVRYMRDAMSRRKVRISDYAKKADGVDIDHMSRIYAVESMTTGIGATADHRLPLKPTEIESFVRALAKEVGVAGVPAEGALPETAKTWAKEIAADLKDAKKKGLVVAGDTLSVAAHNLVCAINDKLGAVKNGVVKYVEPIYANIEQLANGTESLRNLALDMNTSKVDAVIVFGTNLLFSAPEDLGFAVALEKVKTRFYVGAYADETAAACEWHINAAHDLEVWGDARGHDGTASIIQPLIALHNSKASIEVLAGMLDKPQQNAYNIVREIWGAYFTEKKLSGDFDTFWHTIVERGVIDGTASPVVAVGEAKLSDETAKSPAPATKAGEIELSFKPDPTVYDGRYANNGWLQETPKPITLICWDNVAVVSPATAAKLKCDVSFKWSGGEHGSSEVDIVEIEIAGRKAKIPVWVLPGHADDTITLYFGYGRTRGVGEVGRSGVGFNVYPLRTTANLWTVTGLQPTKDIARTQERYIIACTQGQHAMEGRRPARHGTIAQAREELDVEPHGDHAHYHVKNHKHAFSFADNPPASAAEKDLMRALLPGTPEERERLHQDALGGKFGGRTYQNNVAHDDKADKKGDDHDHHHHDKRLTPLTLIADHVENKLYRRWAMAIDLGACVGCNACVVACVSENNIPVIGKDQVNRGRIMHWIRIDRYFAVPEEAGGTKRVDAQTRANLLADATQKTETYFQPVICQQCEKAPCELVCPVAATAHSADGLNDMAYNRCVGTRYCANNCPYKVRRFNFLQYANYDNASTLQLVNNPEVTLRTRGVMEKCTYCVQRIRNAEIEAEREHDNPNRVKVNTPMGVRPLIGDGEVKTACQTACPAGAIAFGDLNYDQYTPVKKTGELKYEEAGKSLGFSEVSRWKLEPTNYGLLAELNTMPRTSYLAAIKNKNPKLA